MATYGRGAAFLLLSFIRQRCHCYCSDPQLRYHPRPHPRCPLPAVAPRCHPGSTTPQELSLNRTMFFTWQPSSIYFREVWRRQRRVFLGLFRFRIVIVVFVVFGASIVRGHIVSITLSLVN